MTTTEAAAGRWEAIGGRPGGTVSALAISPAFLEDGVVFAATLAGVHRSTDGGATWQNVSHGLTNPFVDAIAVSPAFAGDRTVFVGGREAGVSRSLDGGATWEPLPFWSQTPPSIAALAISPDYPTDGTVFAGAEDGTVYRTTTGGRSWDAVGRGLAGGPVLALAVSPGYAGDGTLFAATPAGVFRSEGGGEEWRPAGLAGPVAQAIALSPTFHIDGVAFAGTEEDGVLISRDGGATWAPANEGLPDRCVNALAVSPGFTVDRVVLAATASGLARSEDGGDTWTAVGPAGSVLSVAAPPREAMLSIGASGEAVAARERTALAGLLHEGVVRSTDGGRTWAASNDGLAARLLVALAISPVFADDGTLFAGGLEEGLGVSRDGGRTWVASNDGLPSLEVAGLAVSPAFAVDGVVVAATGAGVAISRDGGRRWTATGGPSPVQALAIAPNHERLGALLAAGPAGELQLSADSGLTWRALTAPFAGDNVVAVAFSPAYADDRTLVVATSRPAREGAPARTAVWQSADDGATWASVLEERVEQRWLSLAVPATYRADGAFYVGLGGAVLRPMRRASESRFGGRRPLWVHERLGGRLTTVVHLALSPAYERDSTLFAATSTGVYVSRNAGLGWRALAVGLAERSVVGVAVSPAYAADGLVFAAGLGGTIWRLVDGARMMRNA